jgi:hypothetical protein
LISDFSEGAAHAYFKRGYESYKRNRNWLEEALGENYPSEYDAYFLPSVHSEEISDVAPLSSGSNGIVYSAKWKRKSYTEHVSEERIAVVLKQPKQPKTDASWKESFINEVLNLLESAKV